MTDTAGGGPLGPRSVSFSVLAGNSSFRIIIPWILDEGLAYFVLGSCQPKSLLVCAYKLAPVKYDFDKARQCGT